IPDRQPRLETEADQVVRRRNLGCARRFRSAERDHRSILELQLFPQVVQHYRAAERRGQRGDEQAVVTTRQRTRDRRRRIPTESVRNEPLALQQWLRPGSRLQREWSPYLTAMHPLDRRAHSFPFRTVSVRVARETRRRALSAPFPLVLLTTSK